MEALVGTAWLAEHLADVLVFDATYFLPNEGLDAHALFQDAHIPGARFFDIDAIADAESSLPHMVPSASRFEALVSALGIGPDSRIVFYDQKGIFSAPRAWWLMRLFGHDQAAVLDGGLPAWRAEGRPIQQGEPDAAAPGRFQASLRARRLRGLGDMRESVASGQELVLDARPAARFDGSAPEPRPGLPSGHMPGAVSLPAPTLLREGRYLPPSELRARFTAAGVNGTRPVVTSCGSGVSAALLTLGLHLAGLEEGALYDGSWTEWASRADTPKATR